MDRAGTVESIFIAPDSGEPMSPVESVDAVAGRGLRGDRYFKEMGLYDRNDDLPPGTDVSLIETEALDAAQRDDDISLPPEKTRRNILTRDVPLNHLVDETFQIGTATFEGDMLCEPCSYMEGLADVDGAMETLVHRGGLNATIIESGTIAVDDEITF